MFQIHCLNPISRVGLDEFTENYRITEGEQEAAAVRTPIRTYADINARLATDAWTKPARIPFAQTTDAPVIQ